MTIEQVHDLALKEFYNQANENKTSIEFKQLLHKKIYKQVIEELIADQENMDVPLEKLFSGLAEVKTKKLLEEYTKTKSEIRDQNLLY